MLATAILLGCTVVLVELSNQGRRNAMAAIDEATAQSICLAYVNEMLAGIRLHEQQEPTASEEHPGWMIGIEVLPLEQEGLSAVTVTVEQEENKVGKLQSFSITRWMADRSEADALTPGESEFAVGEGTPGDEAGFGPPLFGSPPSELSGIGSSGSGPQGFGAREGNP